MLNLLVRFTLLLLLLVLTSTIETNAQNIVARLFKTGKYRNYNHAKMGNFNKCGSMGAYNTYKKERIRVITAKHAPKPASPKPPAKPSSPNADAQAKAQPKENPASTSASAGTGSGTSAPPKSLPAETPASNLIASSAPALPTAPTAATKTAHQKSNSTALTQEALKNMTEEQRRQVLKTMQPEIILPPIRFIQDQDEFSVANMDSFMQAMEYAQEGKIVLIEGHTDDLGSEDYNLKLSMKRAEKIRQLLLSGGVADELISVIGYGESQPLVPNNSTENRSINRRIEFKVFSIAE